MQPIITHDSPTLSHHLCHFLAASRDSPPLTPTLGEQLTIALDSHSHCPLFCSSRTTLVGLQQPLPFSHFYKLWPTRDILRQPHSSSFLLPTTLDSPSLFSHLNYLLADVGGLIQTLPSSHSSHSPDHDISRQYSPSPYSTPHSGISWQPQLYHISLHRPSEPRQHVAFPPLP